MGKNLVILEDARAVADPIYIPAADPRHSRALVTVMTNETRGGKTYSERHQLVFWGKAANSIAQRCGKGKGVNIVGRLHSYLHDTQRLKDNGKKEQYSLTSVNVRDWNFSGFSKKEQLENVGRNLTALIAAGRLPANCDVTPDELMAMPEKTQMVDYNPGIHTQKYGFATVWARGAAPAPAKASEEKIDPNDVGAMKARIAQIEGGEAATKEAVATAAPFQTK